MRNATGHYEIDLDVRDSDLKTFLAEAQAFVAPEGVGKKTGDKLDLTPIPWAWDGIIMQNRMNLLVAQPKVGKTGLLLEMISKWCQHDQQFLERDFHGECPSVVIVGTDQGEADWASMLRSVALVGDDGTILDPIKRIWTAADPLFFNEKGFKSLEDELEKHENCLVLVDSYHTCVSPLGYEDSGSTYANALAALLIATSKHQATCCVIHHANKGTGFDVVSSSRGTTALTAIPSQLIHMAFMRPEDQRDRRITLKTQGRAGNPVNLLIERQEHGWVSHGDGAAVEAAEQREELCNELSGRQADLYDYIQMRWELGCFAVAASEVAAEFNLPGNKANRYLLQLVRKGLIEECGKTEPGTQGGRPSTLYQPFLPSLPGVGKTRKTGETPPLVHEKWGFSPFSRLSHTSEGGGFFTLSKGTAVERLMPDGEWIGGWLISDGSNPDAVTIEKLGDPMLRIRNMRWDIDLRASVSAFKSSDDPEPPSAAERPSEAIPEALIAVADSTAVMLDDPGNKGYVF